MSGKGLVDNLGGAIVPDVDPVLLEDETCDKCDNDQFVTGTLMKEIGAVQSASGKPSVWMSYILVCMDCHEPKRDIHLKQTRKVDKMPTVKAEDCEGIVCQSCEYDIFTTAILAKKVTALQSASGKDTLLTQMAIVCMRCHEPSKNLRVVGQ